MYRLAVAVYGCENLNKAKRLRFISCKPKIFKTRPVSSYLLAKLSVSTSNPGVNITSSAA